MTQKQNALQMTKNANKILQIKIITKQKRQPLNPKKADKKHDVKQQ